jgi:autotransporter-associated beta strand protein
MSLFRRRALLIAIAATTIPRVSRAQVTFTIDPTQGHSAISPFIYGVNGAVNQSQFQNANPSFQRLGGNRWTAYNWNNNASNAGSDYLYENDNYLGGGNTPGGAVLPFVQAGQNAGAGVLVTVPINGYVAADFSGPQNPSIPPQNSTHFVPEYPTQAQDPAPSSNHVYQNGFVQLIANNFKSSASQPLVFDLDNEPDLWNSTHQEVHPAQTTYAELLQKSIAYATMIKSVAPTAQVFGPVSYGWEGYLTLQNAPDSAANGNFLNYYLHNMATASSAAGTRLLDALDLHWYPEATGMDGSNSVRIINDDTSPGVVAARLQAPRSLWDPKYTENSWITQYSTLGPINLIPRLQGQINANYPGTKLAFSEYNYGAGEDISGGLAETDVLGIFGKYGVYSANEWPSSSPNDNFVAGAIQLYRNYDGHNSTFGNTEVQANNSDTINTSVYASIDAANPQHLTLVAENKETSTVTATLNISSGPAYKTAAVYQLTSASSTPQFVGNIAITNPASFNYSMPAYSATLFNFFVPGQTVGTWGTANGGSWSTLGNWLGAPPQTAGDTANFTGSINVPSTVRLDGTWSVGAINFNNAKSYTIAQGSGGTLTLDNGANQATVADLGGSHSITAPVALNSSTTVTVANSTDTLQISGPVSGAGSLTVAGAGSLTLAGASTYAGATFVSGNLNIATAAALPMNNALTIQSTGRVTLAQSIGGLQLQSSSIASGGKLDITNNHLLINYAGAPDPISSIAAYVASGYNNGAWNGPGINSSAAAANSASYALGYADSSDPGNPAGLSSATIEIKYTLLGDADLNGTVNGIDFGILAANFNHSVSRWDQGDFNYDNIVNGIDFTSLAANFNEAASGAAVGLSALSDPALLAFAEANGLMADVPEPAAPTVLLLTSATTLLHRGAKRRRSPK